MNDCPSIAVDLYRRRVLPTLLVALTWASVVAAPTGQWYKGNLHTHTLWSDGDEYPERVTAWYRDHGYHFLVLSDHNIVQHGERWIDAAKSRAGLAGFRAYLEAYGDDWVDQRIVDGSLQVRLKNLDEIRQRYEAPGRFLLMTGEEITDHHDRAPVHLNAYPIAAYIPPQHGTSIVDVIQRNVDAVLAHRRETGLPSVAHVNHPNFGYAITAEHLMQVTGEKFFEVYNGHPHVHNEGDAYHAGLERVWDILLSFRLGELNLPPFYGLAVDDAHNYHTFSSKVSNPGRGWIMVRAEQLNGASLVAAMEAGDFYASSGVLLDELNVTGESLSLRIRAQPGVTYTTRFIGTRRGFDRSSQPGPPPPNGRLPVTRQYSSEIGSVLAEQTSLTPSYHFRGNELYVRATVSSSKLKENPYRTGEHERAWIQPVIPSKIKSAPANNTAPNP